MLCYASDDYGISYVLKPCSVDTYNRKVYARVRYDGKRGRLAINLRYKLSNSSPVKLQKTLTNLSNFLQNVEQKSILEIAQDLMNLQEKGSKGQLGLSDLTGGTFTISNIGIVSTYQHCASSLLKISC